jgi:hypothetical protein
MPKKHRALLTAHFEAPKHTVTWDRLAKAVGYESGRAVNLQYGTLAHRVANILGVFKKPQGFWIFVFADCYDFSRATSQANRGTLHFVLKQPGFRHPS